MNKVIFKDTETTLENVRNLIDDRKERDSAYTTIEILYSGASRWSRPVDKSSLTGNDFFAQIERLKRDLNISYIQITLYNSDSKNNTRPFHNTGIMQFYVQSQTDTNGNTVIMPLSGTITEHDRLKHQEQVFEKQRIIDRQAYELESLWKELDAQCKQTDHLTSSLETAEQLIEALETKHAAILKELKEQQEAERIEKDQTIIQLQQQLSELEKKASTGLGSILSDDMVERAIGNLLKGAGHAVAQAGMKQFGGFMPTETETPITPQPNNEPQTNFIFEQVEEN